MITSWLIGGSYVLLLWNLTQTSWLRRRTHVLMLWDSVQTRLWRWTYVLTLWISSRGGRLVAEGLAHVGGSVD
jgi:hypothetical protein